jgi:glycosyltransferase involved in cell wall biosynthesis
LEAIANKLVPIVTKNVPWPELEEQNAGYRVPAGNSDAILRAILDYSHKSENEKMRMKESAFNVAHKFDKSVIARLFAEMIRKIQ